MQLTNMVMDLETKITKLKPVLPIYLRLFGSILLVLGFIGFAVWRNPISAWAFVIGIFLALFGFKWDYFFPKVN